MNAQQPKMSLAGQTCPACGKGKFETLQIDHVENVHGDNPIIVHNVWVDRCDQCGEVVFPAETVHFIERVVAEETEQLTGSELERIRQDLGVDRQDEMSEILGLGSKTYHRWESSAQFPTRSMCYYIRVLAEYPEAFEWLRARAWRKSNRVTRIQSHKDWPSMFPDLSQASRLNPRECGETGKRFNPALGLSRVVFNVE